MHYARRSGVDPVFFLDSLILYLQQDYHNNPLHPTHKSQYEKEISRLRKKMRRLKTSRRRQWYIDKIKELQNAQANVR